MKLFSGLIFTALLGVVIGVLLNTDYKKKPLNLHINEPDAKILVFNGDDVSQEFSVKSSFVFILKRDGVFYTDTTQSGFWKADYTDLSMLGEGHRKAVLKRIQSK